MEEKIMDLEIAALKSISEVIDHYIQEGLTDEARHRIIDWVRRKYGDY